MAFHLADNANPRQFERPGAAGEFRCRPDTRASEPARGCGDQRPLKLPWGCLNRLNRQSMSVWDADRDDNAMVFHMGTAHIAGFNCQPGSSRPKAV
jgi:hypothetical protein